MNKHWLILIGACAAFLAAGCIMIQPVYAADAERHDVLYSCEQGKCGTASIKPGNCACGLPMKWGHVIKVEGNEAILCQCGEGCKCSGLDPKNPGKCVCGTPVKRVSYKGTGLYFCNCGGSCTCNFVSDKPGKCKCGMDLKKVN